jgi:hypothetical protein
MRPETRRATKAGAQVDDLDASGDAGKFGQRWSPLAPRL